MRVGLSSLNFGRLGSSRVFLILSKLEKMVDDGVRLVDCESGGGVG